MKVILQNKLRNTALIIHLNKYICRESKKRGMFFKDKNLRVSNLTSV